MKHKYFYSNAGKKGTIDEHFLAWIDHLPVSLKRHVRRNWIELQSGIRFLYKKNLQCTRAEANEAVPYGPRSETFVKLIWRIMNATKFVFYFFEDGTTQFVRHKYGRTAAQDVISFSSRHKKVTKKMLSVFSQIAEA